ncbi:MATE family efflux transporter [Pontibacter sp. G13]|uniref:MATE family efflux transporter n=1 Tax=Pontibacter sp. G13 TaxID=3074898 RepID=UPI0028894797|nr:MATE family efflux transporter [Pontibacter sp. G13]WNJ17925.1 MATE family efflux transporter [Pontibacter sp. G13]
MNLLKDPASKVLFNMSWPTSLGMLSTILFQVVDTYFVGSLGPKPLAALGFASTVYFLLVGLFIGLTIATSMLLGKAVGGGKGDEVRRIASIGLLLSLAVGLFVGASGIISLDPLFRLLGATPDILVNIRAYMVPMYAGMPILAMGIVASAIPRTMGEVKTPEVIFGIAGLINAFLDYAFIFGAFGFPALGIKGVAYGTVISWIFIWIAMAVVLLRGNRLSNPLHRIASNLPILDALRKMGLPAIAAQMVAPLSLMFLTFLLGRVSADAVAAYGVAGRIETLMMIGIMGVSTAMTPFIAQNFGAKQVLRIDEAIVFGGKAASYLGLFVMFLMFVIIRPLAGVFTDSQEIIEYTTLYFYLVSGSYVFYGLYQVTVAIFQGLQMPKKSLRIVVVRTFLLVMPLAFIGSYWGVLGIFIGITVGNVLGGVYAGFEMRKELRRVGSHLVDRNPARDMWRDVKQMVSRGSNR